MSGPTISTHVLDVALGQPAEGVSVTVQGQAPKKTDRQGRIADLAPGGLPPGRHQLAFEVGAYFADRPHLFETVILEVTVADAEHYHVPLLIAPFACSTYRGS